MAAAIDPEPEARARNVHPEILAAETNLELAETL